MVFWWFSRDFPMEFLGLPWSEESLEGFLEVVKEIWRKTWTEAMTRLRIHVQYPLVNQHSLVGGLEHGFYDFPYVGNVIIPTDFHIFPHQPDSYWTWSIYR